MRIIEYLHHLDQNLTLALNSLHSGVTDGIWVLFSDRWVWAVMYLVLAFLLLRRLGWKRGLAVLLCVALTVVACDQLGNLVKNSVARLRPVWDNYMVSRGLHRLEGRGNFYGFFSAHAANTFGVAMCVVTGYRAGEKKSQFSVRVAWILFVWAAMVSLSRVFVGKHFLGDVLVGVLVGLLIGWLFGRLSGWVIRKLSLSL